MILASLGIIATSRGVSDSDAQAFITSASITDTTQKTAINQLVLDLKTANIWTKMKAIYPFVGGTASQHRFNLKDPRPVAGAFYLDFFGGVTHSSNGVQFDGATGYANTNLSASSILTNYNVHMSHYSRTQTTSTNSHDMGAEQGSPYGYNFDLYQYYYSVNQKGLLDGDYPDNACQLNNTNTLGFLIGTRTANNNQKIYFNNTLQTINTNIKTKPLPSPNIYIGATNNDNVAAALSTKQCAFSSIGDGLSDSDATAFYNAVQTFNTTLSRQV